MTFWYRLRYAIEERLLRLAFAVHPKDESYVAEALRGFLQRESRQ